MRKATTRQWILFSVITLLYILFTIWAGNYWLLLGVPLIFDIYISKIIPWGAWKKSKNKTLKKTMEWVDAILFALVAVYLINVFIFQNYKIPSSSLEKTLLVGDYLFVSKLSYGPRVPNTPLSFPLTQNTFPIINTKSYLEWPKWDYKRLKGFGDVKRNDIVVFNFPAGDTIAFKEQNPDYYNLLCQHGYARLHRDKATFGDIMYRPVDRRENFVKRCIGMPGDSLHIVENQVRINGKALPDPEFAQHNYFVETTGNTISQKQFDELGISPDDYKYTTYIWNAQLSHAEQWAAFFELMGIERNTSGGFNPVYNVPLTAAMKQKLEQADWIRSIHIEKDYYFQTSDIYPCEYDAGWSRDNYGPIWIPKKGASIALNPHNIALYKRCIVNYEGNTLTQKGGQIHINDQPVNTYTFKYDYYFMLGDNRHKSADSRSWGFVPEDHIVGKPILIWMSLDKDKSLFNGGIRWDRLFKNVTKC